jgi:hypothetical protein
MPHLPITVEELGPATSFYVSAFMAHPLDEQRREEFWLWLAGKILLADPEEDQAEGAEITITRREFNTLLSAATRGVGDDLVDASIGGQIAGEVLLYVLKMRAHGIPDGGLDRAQHLTSQYFSSVRRFDGKTYKSSRDTVRQHWESFHPVAHFWGAWSILNGGEPERMKERGLPHHQDSFFSIAAALLDMADSCRLPRSKQVLLPRAKAWELVGVQAARVTPPRLTEVELGWLASFQPRFR